MKKLFALLLALCLALTCVAATADVAETVAAAADMTREELAVLAQAEEGTFVVYGNTSRIANAAEAFGELYGITVESNNLKDAEIYTKLESEIGSSVKGADMVMIQDGAQLTYAIEDGWVVNYVPVAARDSVAAEDQEPLIQQMINKTFIYNKLGDDVPAIRNVWELTAPEMKGRILFKNPESEQVNMNFLVMLTNDEWSAKLADAYKSWSGSDIDLGSYKNAGYKWIAEFLQNCTFGSSDTTLAEETSQETAAGKIGLFVLSKLRSSSVLTENLTVAEYDAVANGYTIEPFAGFMYPMYAMVSAAATRPYTAMLFIDYLMTADGFAPWGKSIGAYSSSTAIAPNEGDLDLATWKSSLVMEDASYILDNYEAVSSFVSKYLQ